MEPQVLKTRLAALEQALAAVDVTSEMHASVREKIGATLDGIADDAERELTPSAKASSDADLRDGVARLFRQLAITNSWLHGREARSREWIDRAAELATSDVLRDLAVSEQNRLREGEAFSGIAALCQRGLVDKARRTLVARRKTSTDPVMRKRIDEILADPRHLLAPLGAAPAMFTLNGFGTMLHGSRNRNPDGTYVATLCLVFIFIPVIPLRSYLIRAEGTGYRFFGRVPLSPFAFWYRRLALLVPALIALFVWGSESLNASPYVLETRALAAAERKIGDRNFIGGLGALADVRSWSDPGRAARADRLTAQALTQSLGDLQSLADAQGFLGGPGAVMMRMRRPLAKESADAAEAALLRIASQPNPGKVVHDFLAWMSNVSPDFAARQPELAVKAAEGHDAPELLANAALLHVQAGRACPPALLGRLKSALLARKHPTWPIDALSYLKAADPADARPVLQMRIEAAWKGLEKGADLLPLKGLPEPCRKLLTLDAETSLDKLVAELEKAADPAGLDEPQKTWHRLGAARRLAKAYGQLNEQDPIRTPVAKVRVWAIQAAELAPDDGPTRITAMRYLIEEGDFARAIAMGSAAEGDPKTDILTGIALARSGKAEEAAKLLRAIVTRELPGFSQAVQAWENAVENKTKNLWRTLELGTADSALLNRLHSLPKDKVGVEADKWVRREVQRDPYIAQLSAAWRDRLDVHPAASELAMIELSLGRSLPPGADRQARFHAAERLFLDLRKINPEDSQQELHLGQVYFWLGKDKEGAEIFDRIEKSGDAHLLHQLGEIYRGLSRFEAARAVLEKAYAAAAPNDKSVIAMTRSLATFDYEDKLAWLKKCDTSNGRIRAELDQTSAEVDMQAGRYAQAVAPFQRVADYYAGQEESSTALNNGAVVQLELARATGDLKYQTKALGMMRRALELSPESPIVLSNYVSDLGTLAVSALAGGALRADLLHELPSKAWMDYAVPQPSLQEWAARAKSLPELRRSSDLGAKSVILSPDGTVGYTAQLEYFVLTRDLPGLRRLRESIEANPPPRAEDLSQDLAHGRGEYSESERKAIERNIAHWDLLLPQLRKAGHAPTLAYALVHSASARLGAFQIGMAGSTLESAVREIEEAVVAFDSAPVREALSKIRMEQAAQALAGSDADFAPWLKENTDVAGGILLALYARRHPEKLQAIQARKDVQQASQAAAATLGGPGDPLVRTWAWLDFAGHEARDRAKKEILADDIHYESMRVKALLNRGSAQAVINVWLAAQARGDRKLTDAIAADARAVGVAPHFFRE